MYEYFLRYMFWVFEYYQELRTKIESRLFGVIKCKNEILTEDKHQIHVADEVDMFL